MNVDTRQSVNARMMECAKLFLCVESWIPGYMKLCKLEILSYSASKCVISNTLLKTYTDNFWSDIAILLLSTSFIFHKKQNKT